MQPAARDENRGGGGGGGRMAPSRGRCGCRLGLGELRSWGCVFWSVQRPAMGLCCRHTARHDIETGHRPVRLKCPNRTGHLYPSMAGQTDLRYGHTHRAAEGVLLRGGTFATRALANASRDCANARASTAVCGRMAGGRGSFVLRPLHNREGSAGLFIPSPSMRPLHNLRGDAVRGYLIPPPR